MRIEGHKHSHRPRQDRRRRARVDVERVLALRDEVGPMRLAYWKLFCAPRMNAPLPKSHTIK
jgi:hypothetical protein